MAKGLQLRLALGGHSMVTSKGAEQRYADQKDPRQPALVSEEAADQHSGERVAR